jgi:LmbE family N-acetylglucosaminyl deacetylase
MSSAGPPPPPPPRLLAVSPHLDDVAFSCGGALVVLGRAGWDVRVVTVFTRTVTPLSAFALACQLDKGLDADVDYMALRRDEDVHAMRCLSVASWQHLDLPEAPHRGYVSAPDLFAGRHRDDDALPLVRDVLAGAVADADLVLGPQGLGDHVDHVLVRDALDQLEVPLLRYRDTPYAMRLDVPEAGKEELAVPVGPALTDKIAACACYASQLGFQFGGPAAMASALRAFAEAEGARSGLVGPAEVLAGPSAERSELADRLPGRPTRRVGRHPL